MSNIYKYIIYILLSIFCKIYAEEIIFESNNINNFENVINEKSQNEENLILRFKEKYYDMSNLSFERINLLINSNITFLGGYSDKTVFDFKNSYNGMMNITYSNKTNIIVKFENIIFKNSGQYINQDDFMLSVNFYSDENYLKFENCTFIDNQYTLFKINMIYKNENNNISNSDYFITFINSNF